MSSIADVDDDGKLKKRYQRKKWQAKDQGLTGFLSLEEYANLIREAGIKSSDIGWLGYHLSRYEDCGSYVVGNCRFITYKDNKDEQNPARVSEGLKRYYAENPPMFIGCKHSNKTKQLISIANAVAQLGERNSQFGTCWITDGKANKKIKRNDPLPSGWLYGRKLS